MVEAQTDAKHEQRKPYRTDPGKSRGDVRAKQSGLDMRGEDPKQTGPKENTRDHLPKYPRLPQPTCYGAAEPGGEKNNGQRKEDRGAGSAFGHFVALTGSDR